MRTLNFLAGATMILAMASCADDDAVINVNGNATAVENNIKSGTWRITSYIDSGNDETGHFTGYTFDFDTNGTVTAANGTNTYNGTWSVTDDDAFDDSPDDANISDIDFNLAFAAPNDFAELTDDWEVVERSGVKIVLADVSGNDDNNDDDIDYLTFEKN